MNQTKYRLKEIASKLSKDLYSLFVRKAQEECQISRATLYRWMDIPAGSKREIAADCLEKLAALLSTTTDELKNYTVTRPKSIREIASGLASAENIPNTGLKPPKNK